MIKFNAKYFVNILEGIIYNKNSIDWWNYEVENIKKQ